MTRRFGLLHITFLGAVGLTGWIAVTAVTVWPPVILRPWSVHYQLALVLVLCAIARFLAFKVFRRVRIALDSVFYVASTFALGIVPAAWLVLLVLTADTVIRTVRDSGTTARRESPWFFVLAEVFYRGGLPALMLLAVGVLFDVDGLYPRDDLTLAWFLPAFATAFLVLHYLFAGGSHWFEGAPPQDLWRRFFLRVVPSELILTPISLAMVYGYVHQGFAPFILLGTSALLFNWIFRRARIARDKLRQRVQELSTLNKVGHIVSGSLERHILLQNISSETLRLVGHRSRFMIGVLDHELNHVDYELFDEGGRRYNQITAPADEGLSGWIMAHRRPLLLDDVQRDYDRFSKTGTYNDPRFHSWLGVPLITHDEVMGVMAVQTEERSAYLEETVRVLMSIAEQAAVALENSRLYELATVDGLTELLVRRHFDLRLREEWGRSRRYENDFSLGIFDLDNFKELNDTYGHQAGDQVLRAAAAVVRNNMRTADLAGRYGGEEFAFILPRASVAEACTVAERIRSDIESMTVVVEGCVLRTRASIGVAGWPESGVDSVDDLVARADEALYQAKRLGKNRVVAAPTVLPAAKQAQDRSA